MKITYQGLTYDLIKIGEYRYELRDKRTGEKVNPFLTLAGAKPKV